MENSIAYPRKVDVLKIFVTGDQKGKTAFIKCIVFGAYDPYLESALQLDFMTREIKVEDELVIVQLWKTEPPSYHCAVIIYDVTNRSSFEYALKKLEYIRQQSQNDLPVLLLANKIDTDKKRQVMLHEGELAALHHSALFNEISCTEATNARESLTIFIGSLLSLNSELSTEE